MLRFYTLGSFELLEGDPPAVRLVPAQPKRLVLLAYLALAAPRGFHRRDTLLALFWPELPQEEARRALRQALHHLRRALGEGAIETRADDQVRLADQAVWCDALAFERGAAEGRVEEAIALYRNEFLRGVHVPEAAPELEEWVDQTRARLRQVAVRAARELSERAERAGDLDRAVDAARLAHSLSPDDETGLRQLLQLLERTGDRAQALLVYDRFAKRLHSEYQAAPSPEIAAYARELRAPVVPLPPTTAPVATEEARSPAEPRPRPRRRGWLLVAFAATVLAVAGALILRAGGPPDPPSLLSAGQLERRDRVIVADFENHTRDSLLAPVVTTAVRIELAQSPLIRVMSPSSVQGIRRLMRDVDPGTPVTEAVAHEVAAREGVKIVVEGDVSGVGSGWVISAQLVAAGSGEPLATVREVADDSTRLLESIDRVARALRRRLGESAQAIRAEPPLSRVTTASLDALRRFTEAQYALDVSGDRPRARRLLEDAVALDSSFAMAWRALSILYTSLGPAASMVDAATRAYRHRDRLPGREGHLVTAVYHDVVTRDYRQALAAYDAQLAATPDDATVLGAAGFMHFRLREFEEAERLYRRSMEADSGKSAVYFGLIESRINLGRTEGAREALAAFRSRFPENHFAEWEEIYLAAAAADFERAGRYARRLLAAAPDDADHRGEATHTLANLALLHGRADESARLRRSAMRIYEQNGDIGGYFGEALALATAEIRLRHRPERARRILSEALGRHPLDSLAPVDRPYVELGILQAELGDLAGASAMLASFERHGLARGRLGDGKWRRLRGSILLARGRYLEAQAELRRADEQEECALCALYPLARSYDLAGRGDSAIAVYERYLHTPWMKRLEHDALSLGPVCLRLEELYEERSNPAEAALMRRRVSELWREGDAEFRQAVVRGRERTGVE